MSGFLNDVKDQITNDNIEKWIRMGERKENRPVNHDLFNFMVLVGRKISDSRSGLRAYHWLKWCNRFYKKNDTIYIDYVDKNSATWALNFIGDGVRFSQNVKNVVTLHNGEYVNSLLPPERNTGEVNFSDVVIY